MSDYKSHTGKLIKIEPKEGESLDDLCQRLWVENGKSLESFDSDDFFDDLYEKYINVNDVVWEIFEHEELGDEDDMFCKVHDNKDGTYSFHTRFYNGGTYLTEMLEAGIKENIK